MASNQEPIPGQRNILITSALPYVNNVPHLGNIIGCVLSADVYARYCKQRGYNALYIGGTDEYGTTTEQKAIAEKTTPEKICEKYHELHKKIYEWFDISFDRFGRTSTEKQTEITQEIFWELYNNGYICPDTVEQLFCENCDRFLADRFVEGTCPDCGAPGARGDQCDSCQHIINAINLKDPKCKLCGKSPIVKTSKHLFIDLPKLTETLSEYIEQAGAESRWSTNALNIARSWAKDLHKRCITRDLKWGTPVPLEGFKDKVFYVWFDAPIGYISITAAYTDKWRSWWKNDKEVDLVQFLGKDNIPFHTVIFPCTLLGCKSGWTTMKHISTTEYLNYEDTKFSKSRGVGVFGDDAMSTGIPSEVFRYYLLSVRPESADTSFVWDEFGDKNNNELLPNLGNFVHRTVYFIYSNWDKKVPAVGELNEHDKECIAKVNGLLQEYLKEMEAIHEREALKVVMAISRAGNQFIQENAPWNAVKQGDKARAATAEVIALNIVRLLAVVAKPFIPGFSKKLADILDLPELKTEFPQIPSEFVLCVPEGHELNEPKPIFRQIPKKEILELKTRFSGPQGQQVDLSLPAQTVDLRLGRVKNVADHPTAEHLYVLTVSLGEGGERTVVAGLRAHFKPEELVEKQVLVVCNLKPGKLHGVKSEGMVLIAEDKEKGTLSLCTAADAVPDGSKVVAEGHRLGLPKKALDIKALQKLELVAADGFCCLGKNKLLVDGKSIVF